MDELKFPNDWTKFLEDYSFRDHEGYYTNGARLIPTFRVEQMMHHYLAKASNTVYGEWLPGYPIHCSVCGGPAPTEYEDCNRYEAWLTKYCPNCGAVMLY